ncbi:MAG TPA: alpha/beta hydrolase [Nitrososphaeraceae archaeon]
MNQASDDQPDERIIRIPIDEKKQSNVHSSNSLEGNLVIPNGAEGIIVFAHGSGSSRHSPRNQYVARVLNDAGLATLLTDLLTGEEEEIDVKTRQHRFNIELLSKRLVSVTNWIVQNPETQKFYVGYFGASTGAAAALVAASLSECRNLVSAIVSRGGRPDLSGSEALKNVQAPTLFIVGEKDVEVIDMNNNAMNQLQKVERKKLKIIPGATHLFDEPGALEEVARLARGWFQCYFLIKKHSQQQ